jgi:hypothetical protein
MVVGGGRMLRLCYVYLLLSYQCQMSVGKHKYSPAGGIKINPLRICGICMIFPILGEAVNHDCTVAPSVRNNPNASRVFR